MLPHCPAKGNDKAEKGGGLIRWVRFNLTELNTVGET